MEKSSSRPVDNAQGSDARDTRMPAVLERVNEKSEICVSNGTSGGKAKTADSNSLRGNFGGELMKFSPLYGQLPPQYFEQFSGLPMQHPGMYVGAMLPPMPLPEAHFPYYPYMYPHGPLALGSPHMFAPEPVPAPIKRERPGAENDRKEYRDTESEMRDKKESSSKKTGSPKTWRNEPAEAMRTESVIKNVSVIKETVENGKTSNERRPSRDNRVLDQRAAKLDYRKRDYREEMMASSALNERSSRASPIFSRSHDVASRGRDVVSRGHDVVSRDQVAASRVPVTDHQSFSSSQSKAADNCSNGAPDYTSACPRKLYDPASSYRAQYTDARMRDVDRRGHWDTTKDGSRVKRNNESELRVNGVKDSPKKLLDLDELKSRNSSEDYMKFMKGDRRFYDEEKRLRYSEEPMSHRTRRDQGKRFDRRKEEGERGPSPLSINARATSTFPVTTAHSVETIMNGRSNASPAKTIEHSKENSRARNEYVTQRREISDSRVPGKPDLKRSGDSHFSCEQRMRDEVARDKLRLDESRVQSRDEARDQRSRDIDERLRDQNRVREHRSRDQNLEDMKIAEMERFRYERAGREFFDPRFMNPSIMEQPGFDPQAYASNGHPRYPAGFDPRKYESRVVDSKTRNEQSDKKHVEERRRNDRSLPEHIRDEGRPRSAPQSSSRSMSPRIVNGNEAKSSRIEKEDVKSRGMNSGASGETSKRNEVIGQPVATKRRSSLKDETNDDVVVSKGNPSVESSRGLLRPGTSAESTASNNVMRAGFGNLVMTPAGTAYPSVPMLNSDPYFQQLIMAQNEGRLPMLFSMPQAMPDPIHAEYMMKAWGEFLQDPSLHFQLLNQQRLAQEKALLAGGKEFVGYPPHLMSAERQRDFLKHFPQQQILELQKRQQQMHEQQQIHARQERLSLSEKKESRGAEIEQKTESEESEAEAKQLQEKREQDKAARRKDEKGVKTKQKFEENLLKQGQLSEEQVPKSLTPEQGKEEQRNEQILQQQQQFLKQWQHERGYEVSHQKQTEQEQFVQQLKSFEQTDEKETRRENLLEWREQAKQNEHLNKFFEEQWKQQFLQQQRQDIPELENAEKQKQVKHEQLFSNENLRRRIVDNSDVQVLKDDNVVVQPKDSTKLTVATLEPLRKEEVSRFQFPEPRLVQEVRRVSLSPPVVSERAATTTDFEPRNGISDVGELSPNCVSAAEVLSRFRSSSSLRFIDNDQQEETGDKDTEILEAELSSSSTPQGEETRFAFYDNAEKDELLDDKSMNAMDNQEQLRCRGDLNELARAAIGSEEHFGTQDEMQVENPGDDCNDELYLETGNTDDDLLSDGYDAGELSPLSDYEDNDSWWWITRSPCVPSARRIPNYQENKENIYAQIKRSEKNRQNICENINRLRKEAKRGLTKAMKDRYATLANHKLILDAESVLNSACSNIKAATEIDGLQVELRDQLLSIQRTYRERHRELARLTPRNKDKHEGSPVKRGPGRPRKRKNCSNSKSNVNNEPDVSAVNSPSADQVDTGSPPLVMKDDKNVDEEGDDGEAKCEMQPAGTSEDKIEQEEDLMDQETVQDNNDSNEPSSTNNALELPELQAKADHTPTDAEVVSKKKLKKKRRRITSDSDPEMSAHVENSEKIKKTKKIKKPSKTKSNEEDNVKKSRKIKQIVDDDVFTTEPSEQGLNLLAKYASNTLPDGKMAAKKRKRSTVSDDTQVSKQRPVKRKPAKLVLKSPPKDSSESITTDMATKPTEQRTKDSEAVAKKVQGEYSENWDKSTEKSTKSKAVALPLPTNEDFFPRRSERIFLSSSSSLNSPTTTHGGAFEIPAVNKKKGKPLGKFVKKKDSEFPEASIEDSIDKEANSEKDFLKKKKKLKHKQEEKIKKKKIKSVKPKGSLSEFTDEEYDEQTFVEEIKQLPKRNRQAPRRYIEYDSSEEKRDDETSGNEQQIGDNENVESDSERTGAECDVTSEAPDNDLSKENLSEEETAEQTGDASQAHEEKDLNSNIDEIVLKTEKETGDEVCAEKEVERADEIKQVDDEKEEGELDSDNEKEKALFPWMFSIAELCKGQKMLLPVEGVYYPGRIADIHVPDLYAIILDGERGRNPHYRSSEQLLTEAVKDVQPLSLDEIPIGRRVCAYWSQQYRCFYPGLVSKVPEDEKIGRNCCWVEFDDGDSGEFPLPDVRLIPPDFPQEDCESISGLPEHRAKKSELLNDGKRTGDDSVSDSGDSTVESSHVIERTRDKRRRDKKDYSKTRQADDDYERTKPTKFRSYSMDSESAKRNSKKKVKSELQDEDLGDHESEIDMGRDAFCDEGPLKEKTLTNFISGVGSGVEPSVVVFPPDGVWRWAGKPCPNRRKGGGRKVFYKSIYRGNEHISVGECAVFKSSPSKNPDLPYVGKIIKMWERFNGKKVVRVKWFYHPEETKAGRRPSDGKNGLYLSSHVDENEVQTIAHKCEVLQLHDLGEKGNVQSTDDSDSDVTNNNIFWCLGTYDPLTETFPSDND